jgi:hypothetical protein
MKLLELFAGSRSVAKEAEKRGWETFSSDIEPFEKIDYVVDILEFDVTKVPFVPDMIWSSSECQGFSIAAIGHNWTGGKGAYIPKSDRAKLGIKLAKKSIEIIEYFKKLNPNLIWYMENPRGVMRKMPFMEVLPIRNTLTYCSYQDKRMKPSDLWTNNDMWMPRKMCKNGGYGMAVIDGKTWCLNESGRPCHEAAPRGAKTGTQGLKGDYERSKIPAELCEEIVRVSEMKYAYKDYGSGHPHDPVSTSPDPAAAASRLNAALRDHTWFFSTGITEKNGEPTLILYLKKDLSELERTMLPDFCEGFRVVHEYIGEILPALAENETNEGASS